MRQGANKKTGLLAALLLALLLIIAWFAYRHYMQACCAPVPELDLPPAKPTERQKALELDVQDIVIVNDAAVEITLRNRFSAELLLQRIEVMTDASPLCYSQLQLEVPVDSVLTLQLPCETMLEADKAYALKIFTDMGIYLESKQATNK